MKRCHLIVLFCLLHILVAYVHVDAAEETFSSPKTMIGTYDNLEEIVNKYPVVLVDFGATWCGACIEALPAIDAFAAKGAVVVTVDIDEQKKLAEYFQITSVPCSLVFNKADVVYRTNVPLKKVEHVEAFVRYGKVPR